MVNKDLQQQSDERSYFWDRGDIWRIVGLYILFSGLTGAIGGFLALSSDELTYITTVIGIFGLSLQLLGSVFLINYLRPKHTLFKLGFQPTTLKWLVIALVLGVIATQRHLPLEYLFTVIPELGEIVSEQSQQLAEFLLFDTGLEIFTTLFLLVVVAPIGEEVFFRSFVQNALAGRFGRWAGIILSGLIFGLYHGVPIQIILAIPVGIVAAWLYDRTGSLWPPMLFHFVINFLVGIEILFFTSL